MEVADPDLTLRVGLEDRNEANDWVLSCPWGTLAVGGRNMIEGKWEMGADDHRSKTLDNNSNL